MNSYEFRIKNQSFIYGDIKGKFKFYVEKGVNLRDFLDDTLPGNFVEKFRQLSEYDEEKLVFTSIGSLINKEIIEEERGISNGTNIIYKPIQWEFIFRWRNYV